MDRDDLTKLLKAYADGTLRVTPDGTVIDAESGDEHDVDDVEAAWAEFSQAFGRVLAWAKAALDRKQDTEGGK